MKKDKDTTIPLISRKVNRPGHKFFSYFIPFNLFEGGESDENYSDVPLPTPEKIPELQSLKEKLKENYEAKLAEFKLFEQERQKQRRIE